MHTTRSRSQGALYGLIAGVNGASCMSVIRVMARRLGLLDAMPPQVLRESLSGPRDRRDAPMTPQILDHAIHLAVGLTGGALYGALFGRRGGPLSGLAWGGAFWAASLLMFAPVLGRRRARAQARLPQAGVNLIAHLVWGWVLALMVRDMEDQDAERQWRADRQAQRVG
jgi:hypothetical protein